MTEQSELDKLKKQAKSVSYDDVLIDEIWQALTELFNRKVKEARTAVVKDAVSVAKDWLENDGRPKHLILDLEELDNMTFEELNNE